MEFRGHEEAVYCLALCEEGMMHLVASGSSDMRSIVWDPSSGTQLMEFNGHTRYINAVALHAGESLFTGSGDRTARMWSISDGGMLMEFKGHTATVWTLRVHQDAAEKLWLFTGGADGVAMRWDVESGHAVTTFEGGHTSVIYSIYVCPADDVHWGVTCGMCGTLNIKAPRYWKVDTDIRREEPEYNRCSVCIKKTCVDAESSIGWEPMEEIPPCVVTGSRDCTARKWNAWTGKEAAKYPHSAMPGQIL